MSGRTESGKRVRVQAGRELKPVTLLGGLQAALYLHPALTEIQSVHQFEPSQAWITAG